LESLKTAKIIRKTQCRYSHFPII